MKRGTRAVRCGVRALVALAFLGSWAGAPSARAEERILALAPHIVETLYAVGSGDQIVGVVRFSDYPPEARQIPQVGSYTGIAVEAALRLEPTLAIALDESVSGLDRLRAMGLEIEYSYPKTVGEVLTDILRLGELVGRAPEARALVERFRARLEALRRNRPDPPVRVFYETWYDPLITAGRPSFLTSALREIGAENVFGDLPIDGPRVSTEAVLRAAPAAIVIPGESRDVAARKRVWRESFPSADVVIVEAAHDLLHRPGPRLIDGMERLQEDLLRATGSAQAARR